MSIITRFIFLLGFGFLCQPAFTAPFSLTQLDLPINYEQIKQGQWYVGTNSSRIDTELGDAYATVGISAGRQWQINQGSLAVEASFINSIENNTIGGYDFEAESDFQALGVDAMYRSKGSIYFLTKLGFYTKSSETLIHKESTVTTNDKTQKYSAGLGAGWKISPALPLTVEFLYSDLRPETQAAIRLNWLFQPPQREQLPPYLLSQNEEGEQQTITSQLQEQQSDKAQANPAAPPAEPDEPKSELAQQPKLDNKQAKNLGLGKSSFAAERAAKSSGCRRPTVTLLRNSWPEEVYQSICANGAFYVISCEWGKCRVLK